MNLIYNLLITMAAVYGAIGIVFVRWNKKHLEKYNTKLSRLSDETDQYLTYNTDRAVNN